MSENGVTLTKTQKARVKWLEDFGCRLGTDFEVGEEGLFIYAADEIVAWQDLAKKAFRKEIEEMIQVLGVGKPAEYNVETLSALNEDHILSQLNDTNGSAGEDEEIVEEVLAAQLEATIEPLIEALEEEAVEEAKEKAKAEAEFIQECGPEAVMEPDAEQEEMAFVITARGVDLGKAFRQAIAARAKEMFETAGTGTDIPSRIQRECMAAWGEITRTRQRGAYAAYRYATAVVRNLTRQAHGGMELHINSYWA